MAQGADPTTGQGFGRWTSLTPEQVRRGQEGAGRARGRLAEHLQGAAVRVGGQGAAGRAARRSRPGRDRRLHRDHHARLLQAGAQRPTRSAWTQEGQDGPRPAARRERSSTPTRSSRSFGAMPTGRRSGSTAWKASERTSRLLTSKGIHNGALVAENYTNGDVLAYVGSAGYYLDSMRSKKFNPKFDVAGAGFRQPGSAFKPLVYTTGFDNAEADAGLGAARRDHPVRPVVDPRGRRRRGARTRARAEGAPVLAEHPRHARDRPHRRQKAVDQAASKANLHFLPGITVNKAGLAGAIGTTEVHLDEMVSVYGAFGNGGYVIPPRFILDVKDSSGKRGLSAGRPDTVPAQGLVRRRRPGRWPTSSRATPTRPINIDWGPVFHEPNGPHGQARPLAAQDGHHQRRARHVHLWAHRAATQEFGPSVDRAWVSGWATVTTVRPWPATPWSSPSDGPGRVWHAFMDKYTDGWPVTDFQRPEGPCPGHDRRRTAAASQVRGRARPSTSGSSTARSRAATTRSTRPAGSTSRPVAAGLSTRPRRRTPRRSQALDCRMTRIGRDEHSPGPASPARSEPSPPIAVWLRSWGGPITVSGTCCSKPNAVATPR